MTASISTNFLFLCKNCVLLLLVFFQSDHIQICAADYSGGQDVIVVPTQLPTKCTRRVVFQDAAEWVHDAGQSALPRFQQIEEVTIEGPLTEELINFVASLPALKAVRIGEQPRAAEIDAPLKLLGNMKHLESLTLQLVEVTPRRCKFLADFKSLVRFECDMTLLEEDLRLLGRLPLLREAHLHMGIAKRTQASPIEPIPGFDRLEILAIPGVDDLPYFAKTANLTTLSVSLWNADDARKLEAYHRLQELHVITVSPEYVTHLLKLENLQKLEVRFLER